MGEQFFAEVAVFASFVDEITNDIPLWALPLMLCQHEQGRVFGVSPRYLLVIFSAQIACGPRHLQDIRGLQKLAAPSKWALNY